MASGRPKRTNARDDMFFEALAASGNVTVAAHHAGYARRCIYEWRQIDEEFARRFAEACEVSADLLEGEARRRGVEGVEEFVVSAGRVVENPETGLPLMKRIYSDALLSMLLKARKPELFGDRSKVELSGQLGVDINAARAKLEQLIGQAARRVEDADES